MVALCASIKVNHAAPRCAASRCVVLCCAATCPALPCPALPCPAPPRPANLELVTPATMLCCLRLQVPAAILQVHVQPCGLGQIPSQDGTQCISCPSSSYSFDPAVDACQPCPAGATCTGGALLVPQQQFWHSAPDSDHIVTCPNNNACAGDTTALLACQNATYDARLDVGQVRSAAGVLI